jgi:hypothetical protein
VAHNRPRHLGKLLLLSAGLAVWLLARQAAADILFAAGVGNIYENYPYGVSPVFATGLDEPEGLAFDKGGDLYEADSGSGNIYEFTPNGTRTTFASGLDEPFGLAFDAAGNLFEADLGSGNIYEFAPDGTRSTFATGLDEPTGLAFDASGDLYEADYGSDNIYKFAPGAGRSTFAGSPPIWYPMCLAFDGSGNLFVGCNGGLSVVYELAPTGAVVGSFVDGHGFGATGVAIDSGGSLYMSEVTGLVKFYLGQPLHFGHGGANTGLAFAPPIPGDANGDGQVDINDLTIVLANFGQTGCAWSQGCMDGDPTGTVDVNDLTIVLNNFGDTFGAPRLAATPEPCALVLLLAAIACLLARRPHLLGGAASQTSRSPNGTYRAQGA